MTDKRNAKGKPFTWSFTALNDFEGCPKRYAEGRFYCRTKFEETEALRWGKRVHTAAEKFLMGVSAADLEALAPVEKYCTAILRAGHRPQAELQIALNRNMQAVSWFGQDAWVRAAIDVVIVKDGKFAVMYDWKTGKSIKDAPDQLVLCAAMLSKVMPHVTLFDGKFVWTQHQKVTGIKTIHRDELPSIWEAFFTRVARMENAWEAEHFPARPSPLCPWCSVEGCVQRRK